MDNAQIIIFLILILYSFEQSNDKSYSSICESSPNPSSDIYDCLDRKNDDFEELGMHCCHRTNVFTDGTTKYECELFMENDDYEDINGYIESEKRDNPNYRNIYIHCLSNDKSYSSICESSPNPSSDMYDCLDRENDDFEELGMHCCHRTNEFTDGTTKYECEFFMGNDNYEDINGYIEGEKRDNPNYKNIYIHCFQRYISFNIVLIISFLFIINFNFNRFM